MSLNSGPQILNIYKPKDITSYDVVRKVKRLLPKKSKIGHFGTLDPFACGVLMIGIHGAQRLNEYVHDFLPKTYIATGILGQNTPTGDLTVAADQVDDSDYLKENIAQFDVEFIENQLREKFLGEYMQAPHKFSAAKYEGKALHKWAREGVEIQKEKKKRHVYSIEVLEYSFPKLVVKYTVSSGTYIRTLFSECAQALGTLGTLEGLERSQVGICTTNNALDLESVTEESSSFAIDEILTFNTFVMAPKEAMLYSNGVRLKLDRIFEEKVGTLIAPYRWIKDQAGEILGLAQIIDEEIHPCFNFSLNS